MNRLSRMIETCGYYAEPSAMMSVFSERRDQDKKWGEQNHAPQWWLAILMEEVGELAQAVLETHFDANPDGSPHGGIKNIRKEAVQCAAVALAMIECIDRMKATDKETK